MYLSGDPAKPRGLSLAININGNTVHSGLHIPCQGLVCGDLCQLPQFRAKPVFTFNDTETMDPDISFCGRNLFNLYQNLLFFLISHKVFCKINILLQLC